MNPSTKEWQSLTRPLFLLCLAAWLCYLPALDATFFSDDDIYLAFKNDLLRETSWIDLGRFFVESGNSWEYLPIRDITYWLDFQVYEDEGFGFHLTNLIWYAGASFVAWWMFRELLLFCGSGGAAEASTMALIGTAVFIAHPSHVETVAWVASRKDLIGGALGMLALVLSVLIVRCNGRAFQWSLVGAVLLMASFGKSTAMVQIMMIAAVIMAGARMKERGHRSSFAIGLLLVIVPAVAAWVIHSTVATNTGIRLENQIEAIAMLERASRILVQLVVMLIFPYPLSFYHDPYSIGSWHWLASFVTLLASCAALFSLFIRPQLWAFGVLLIIVSLLPYLQFVPYSTWSLASERFLFVAVAGFSMIVIDLASRMRSPKLVLIFLVGIFAVCTTIVSGRLQEWRSVDQLRAAEQARMPGFHNAKRDLIVYRLLPEGRYNEAAAVASSLPRDYVSEMLGVYIQYRQAEMIPHHAATNEMAGALCSREDAVWATVERARVAVRSEQDLSFNNIIRWIEQNMPQRSPGQRCSDRG